MMTFRFENVWIFLFFKDICFSLVKVHFLNLSELYGQSNIPVFFVAFTVCELNKTLTHTQIGRLIFSFTLGFIVNFLSSEAPTRSTVRVHGNL